MFNGRERPRQRQRQRDRDRQRQRQTDRHRQRETDRQTDRETGRDRQTETETERDKERDKGRDRDPRQTDLHSVGTHNRNLLKSIVVMSRDTYFTPQAHTGNCLKCLEMICRRKKKEMKK